MAPESVYRIVKKFKEECEDNSEDDCEEAKESGN